MLILHLLQVRGSLGRHHNRDVTDDSGTTWPIPSVVTQDKGESRGLEAMPREALRLALLHLKRHASQTHHSA
jgi:hypothetical protein